MVLTTLFFLAALAAVTLSVQGSPPLQPEGYTHVLKETFSPSVQWVKQQPAPPNHVFVLKIHLSQPHFKTLQEKLYATSDPESPQYGMHLSKAQVDELSAPDPEGALAVDDWLSSFGFDVGSLVRSHSSNWVKIKTTVQTAEEMLNTTYHVWNNTETGESLVRTTRWCVPKHLAGHIDMAHPTTMFGGMKPLKTTFRISDQAPGRAAVVSIPAAHPSPVDPSCNVTITPTCLLQLYNAADYVVKAAHLGNQIAITSYLEQYVNLADLEMFYKALRPEAVKSTFKLVSINGGKNNQTLSEAGAEANLDTQYAFGLTFPTPGVAYTTGGSPPFIADDDTPTDGNEPYLDWVDFVLAQDHVPTTRDDEQTVPASYARKVCDGFAKLGSRGATIIVASGDGGVGDNDPNPATSTCRSNDGKNRTIFLPEFPASCPFVTTVGGTVNVPERAVQRFGSGGGCSNYFPRPAYQDAAVTPFLRALGNTYKGLFNPAGRCYPDVSAQGDRFQIFVQGVSRLIGGTSASAPTFAGIVSLLNDARIAERKPSLGFINPLIYSKASKAFNDITVGNNPGCGTPGFNASKGWDAVTGFGTPNFGKLKDIVLSYH